MEKIKSIPLNSPVDQHSPIPTEEEKQSYLADLMVLFHHSTYQTLLDYVASNLEVINKHRHHSSRAAATLGISMLPPVTTQITIAILADKRCPLRPGLDPVCLSERILWVISDLEQRVGKESLSALTSKASWKVVNANFDYGLNWLFENKFSFFEIENQPSPLATTIISESSQNPVRSKYYIY